MALPSLREGLPQENPYNRLKIGDKELYGPHIDIKIDRGRTFDQKPVKGSNKARLKDNGKKNSKVVITLRASIHAQARDCEDLVNYIEPLSPGLESQAWPISHPVTLANGILEIRVETIKFSLEGYWYVWVLDCVEGAIATEAKKGPSNPAKGSPTQQIDAARKEYGKKADDLDRQLASNEISPTSWYTDQTELDNQRKNAIDNISRAHDLPRAPENVDNLSLE